jgi:hypothetical protein
MRIFFGAVTLFVSLLLLPSPTDSWIVARALYGYARHGLKGFPGVSVCHRGSTTSLSSTDKGDESEGMPTSPAASSRRRPIRIRHGAFVANQQKQEEAQNVARFRLGEAAKDPTLLSNVTFKYASHNDTTTATLELAPTLVRGITEILKLERLTDIQAQTWPYALAGSSIVGRARTGTGKVWLLWLHSLSLQMSKMYPFLTAT